MFHKYAENIQVEYMRRVQLREKVSVVSDNVIWQGAKVGKFHKYTLRVKNKIRGEG